MQVWKFKIQPTDEQVVKMPKGAELLTAQMQGGDLCLWAKVDPVAPVVERVLLVHGTGHEIRYPGIAKYVSSVQMYNGTLVFHVFDGLENKTL